MSKRVATNRAHRWSGAGYVCRDCGAIKDTSLEEGGFSGKGKLSGFDLWLYFAGSGWWLEESEVTNAKEASAMLARKVGTVNIVAGAVLPAGLPLGLFTKRHA